MAFNRTREGLIFADDFDRADGPLGAGWEVLAGAAAISGNVLHTNTANANVRAAAADRAEGVMFAEVSVAAGTAGGFTFRHAADRWAYYVQLQSAGEAALLLLNPGYLSLGISAPGAHTPGSFVQIKAHWKTSYQKMWFGPAGAVTMSATDSAMDAKNGTIGAHNNNTTLRHNNSYYCIENNFRVTAVPAGHKIRIGTRVVVEVAGVCDFPDLDKDLPYLVFDLLDAADVVVETHTPTAESVGGPARVWPGDQYAYSAVAGVTLSINATLPDLTASMDVSTEPGVLIDAVLPVLTASMTVVADPVAAPPPLPIPPNSWVVCAEVDTVWQMCGADYLEYILSTGPNRHHILDETTTSRHPLDPLPDPAQTYFAADATNHTPEYRLGLIGFDSYVGVEVGRPSLINDGRFSVRYNQEPFMYLQMGTAGNEGFWFRRDNSWGAAMWILPEDPMANPSRLFGWANVVKLYALLNGTVRLGYVDTFTLVETVYDSAPGLIVPDEISFVVFRYDHVSGLSSVWVNAEKVVETSDLPPDTTDPSWDGEPADVLNSNASEPHLTTVQHVTVWQDDLPSDAEIAEAYSIGSST